MKKLMLLMAIMLVSLVSVQAQLKGVDFSSAIDTRHLSKSTQVEMGKMYRLSNGYVYTFKTNTIGVKHSYEKVLEILKANNKSFDKTMLDESYLPGWVKNYTDYSDVQLACSTGAGEIGKYWKMPENWVMTWIIDEDNCSIFFTRGEN